MATTYEAIATVTVGSGGAANIEFTSIPGTYTDLLVKMSLRYTNNGQDSANILLNSSSSNFTTRRLYGSGSGAGSDSYTTGLIGNIPGADTTASTFSNSEFYIPNYASSNYKSISSDAVSENNATQAYATLDAVLWSNTAAITAIKVTPFSGNFAQYSTATLYGIKNS